MQVIIERYAAKVSALKLPLTETVNPPGEASPPYFVKATQVKGEMAWASPICVGRW